MKTNPLRVLGLCLAMAAPITQAGTFTADFNNGFAPAGTQLYGDGLNAGVVEATGGFGNTGCLKLTKAVNGVQGSMVIDDLDAGAFVNGFTANFKIRIGGGSATPADGCSFNFANDLPDGTFGEEGAGSGFRISFDIYNNAGEAPAFRIFQGGVQVATSGIRPIAELVTGNAFVDVLVRINPTGTLDVTYNGLAIFTGLNIGFQPIAGGRFGFGGRTGGLNTNQFIDDVNITTSLGEFLAPGIVQQPFSARIVAGYPALMSVTANDPVNSTYQWERQAPGAATFTPITGANAATYASAPLTAADAGTQFRVVVSNQGGLQVTSDPAVFDVVSLVHSTPNTAAFNFDSGSVPAGSNAYGNAFAQANGGFNDSGYMSLTESFETQSGTWTVNDLNGGGPVESIDVAFKLLMTPDLGAVPADGFGFHWATDLPESGFPLAEEAVGTGLSVGFDVYNNGNNEAPAVDVFWQGTRIGGIPVPGALLNTQEAFVDVLIRLSAAGKVDVAFNGVAVVYDLQLPGWTAFSGAKYGFAARTGGLFQRHAVDEVQIRSVAYAGPIAFVSQPQDRTALTGRTASFTVTTNDPSRTAYQWQSASGGGAFTDISGATAATYNTPVLSPGDDGRQFRVAVTSTFNASTAVSSPATLTVVDLAAPAAPQIFDTFNNLTDVDNQGSMPAAVQTLSGNYLFQTGVTSGYLELTANATSQFGTLVVDDFNANAAVGGFLASLKVQINGADPADGWSFSWGGGINPTQVYGGLEAGLGNDLRVSFITYAPAGRSVRVNWRGTQLANVTVPIELLQTNLDVFEEVLIRVTPATASSPALLDVAQDGVIVVRSLALPNLQGLAGARFAVAARTGGASELHAIDDLAIATSAYVGPISIVRQSPETLRVVVGRPVTLFVESNNPPVTTYQWQRADSAGGTFVNVGPNTPEYALPAQTVADNGAAYRCVCTGPTNVVTSLPSVVTVIDPALPVAWDRTINFDDGQIPPDAFTYGSAFVDVVGGLGDSGVMGLTSANNGEQGSFIFPDQISGSSSTGFVTRFFLKIGSLAAGNATDPPADGCSFVWSPEPISGAFGEDGTGTGLVISFDIYDNGGGEAPAIEARWNGVSLGNILVPRALLQSGNDFREVIVRVNPDGTLDLIFGSEVIFYQFPIPGYAPLAGATFGWGGRTGGLNAQQSVDEINLSSFVSDVPFLTISEVGGDIVISFDGVLESSTNLSNWTPMPGQASPLVISRAGLTGRTFYRSRR